jgi:AraC family transcriptional regulator of adaptative response/methylated-DNA-[protein]-cysteine methyltransferase
MNRTLRYVITPCRLGQMLVAAGQRGVCHLRFGDESAALEEVFRRVFPGALRATGFDDPLQTWSAALVDHLEAWGGRGAPPEIPLDLRAGTAFQRRVWAHLRTIPSGEVSTYQQVARAVGTPRGARAVANACARNPVALLVPCHRVVPTGGGPGGYRWGRERKRSLLDCEAHEERSASPASHESSSAMGQRANATQ